MPEEMIDDIDIIRDAIVTYMPGYDENDFGILRKSLEWIDNIDQVLCIKDRNK